MMKAPSPSGSAPKANLESAYKTEELSDPNDGQPEVDSHKGLSGRSWGEGKSKG